MAARSDGVKKLIRRVRNNMGMPHLAEAVFFADAPASVADVRRFRHRVEVPKFVASFSLLLH